MSRDGGGAEVIPDSAHDLEVIQEGSVRLIEVDETKQQRLDGEPLIADDLTARSHVLIAELDVEQQIDLRALGLRLQDGFRQVLAIVCSTGRGRETRSGQEAA